MKTILVAEDDKDIVELLKLYLENASYNVITANDGFEALELFAKSEVDLVILDIMMPKINGYDVLKRIRIESNVPVLFLTAKILSEDKILGLNIGADDYITKPFNPLELIARVNALLRRTTYFKAEKEDPTTFTTGNVTVNIYNNTVKKNDEVISVTATEFKLLTVLFSSFGRVFTKTQLYEHIKGDSIDSDEKTIMVHISNLRDKIEDNPKKPNIIKTVWGIGYKVEKV